MGCSKKRHHGFVEMIVARGIKISPELAQVEQAIEAKKREKLSYGLQFVLPDVALQFEGKNNFTRNFKGSKGSNPNYTKETAALGIVAQLPVFEGGQRYLKLKKANEEILALSEKKEHVKEAVEKEIRTRVNNTLAFYFNTKFAKVALENAEKSFEIVQDNYQDGKASITDLIDSQNNLLKSQEQSKLSYYDFVECVVWIQRAIGFIDFANANADHLEWIESAVAELKRAQAENL
ncbi:MAG: TolC family protein [Candidatus Gastranaerophilales bacterium]|nr:TolC family protein [Candidatus Gastranaerophilales bacterium]